MVEDQGKELIRAKTETTRWTSRAEKEGLRTLMFYQPDEVNSCDFANDCQRNSEGDNKISKGKTKTHVGLHLLEPLVGEVVVVELAGGGQVFEGPLPLSQQPERPPPDLVRRRRVRVQLERRDGLSSNCLL